MERLFFAAHPDAGASVRIDALTQSLCRHLPLRGKPIPAERRHLTLLFVGTFDAPPEGLVPALIEAAQGVASAPFELSFDRVASFNRRPQNRPIVLLAAAGSGAVALNVALAARLRDGGLPFESHRAYNPHLTLLYDDRRVDEQAVEPIRWTVRAFTLMRSLVGRSTHVPLARWTLA